MQIVIDIPESIIEHIKDGSFGARPNDKYLLAYAAMEGIRLPKGHGRLIDADDVKRRMIPLDFSCQNWISEVELSICPTIIEADKEAEDDIRKSD